MNAEAINTPTTVFDCCTFTSLGTRLLNSCTAWLSENRAECFFFRFTILLGHKIRRGETAPNLYRRVTTKKLLAIELTTGSKYMKNNDKKMFETSWTFIFLLFLFLIYPYFICQNSFHSFLYQRTKNDFPKDSFKNIQVEITLKIMQWPFMTWGIMVLYDHLLFNISKLLQ